jgi:replicative DNA helicase
MSQPQLQQEVSSLSKRKLGLNIEAFLRYISQQVTGIQTGLTRLDKQLGGLPGFWSIVGEPKSNKSTFALQIAAYNATIGNPVLFIDQENGRHRTERRLMCHLNNESWSSLHKMQGLREKYNNLSKLPLYFHFGKVSSDEIRSTIVEIMELHPDKKVTVIIDSLQAVARNLSDMRLSVDQWLQDIEALKLEFDAKVSIGIICEKRRGTYGEASVDSAKESGRIEYKTEMQLDMRNSDGQVIIECTINRDGPRGVRVAVTKVLKNTQDERSFCYKLRQDEDIFGI